MSQDILREVDFFLGSLLIGVAITFVYDWLLILRKCVRHNIIIISIEDIIFWIACALGVFYMLYRENNGILRWFAVLGATIGMWVYKRLVSFLFVEIVSACIIRTARFLIKPVFFLGRKIFKLIKKILLYFYRNYLFMRKKIKNVARFVKKKLTIQAKLIKIVLGKRVTGTPAALKERYGQKSGNL